MEKADAVHKFSDGEVAVWHDGGCICIKTKTGYGDPVELADEEAIELANILLKLAGTNL